MGHRISEKNGHLEIELPSGDICLIDNNDKWVLEEFPYWRINKTKGRIRAVQVTRYLKSDYGRVREDRYLHRIIMHKAPKRVGTCIDHRDRNPLNNQKDNLRWVTPAQNTRNADRMAKKVTSRYRGVHFAKHVKTRPWVAQIRRTKGKLKHIGCFATEQEAALAYNKVSREWFGEYGWQNDV